MSSDTRERLERLQGEYEALRIRAEPQLHELSAAADRLALEFKTLVRQAAEAYASGQKELASQLASERRAKQAECEGLNAQANALRRELKLKLDEVKAVRDDLRREQREARDRRSATAQARYPLPSREWGWYSKHSTRTGKTDIMIGKDGDLTEEYPHVHVIHDDDAGWVKVIASRSATDKPFQKLVDAKEGPGAVDQAIEEAQQRL